MEVVTRQTARIKYFHNQSPGCADLKSKAEIRFKCVSRCTVPVGFRTRRSENAAGNPKRRDPQDAKFSPLEIDDGRAGPGEDKKRVFEM